MPPISSLLSAPGVRTRGVLFLGAKKTPSGLATPTRVGGRSGALAEMAHRQFPILGMHKFSGIPVAMRGLVEITMPPGGIVISTGWQAPTGSPEIVRIHKMGKPKTMVRTREGSRRLESALERKPASEL